MPRDRLALCQRRAFCSDTLSSRKVEDSGTSLLNRSIPQHRREGRINDQVMVLALAIVEVQGHNISRSI